MMKRTDYLKLIEEIRNIESKSLDEFIDKEIQPLKAENKYLIETLYKDIHYLIKDIDKCGENDLAVENGGLVIERGTIKLTDYQSRLHSLLIWLHMEITKKFIEKNPFTFIDKMEDFEKNFLNKPDYTPEYKAQLDQIKKSLRKERKQNLHEDENFWSKILDTDNLELKPNIMGIGLNINQLINKFKK